MAPSLERIRRELAYLRGMTEGGGEGDSRVDPQVINRLILLLDEWLEETEQLSRRQGELEEYVEAIDEDLNDLEMTVYEEGDAWEEEEDDGYLKVECPKCRDEVWVDEAVLDDDSVEEVRCPECRTVLLVNREKGNGRSKASETEFKLEEKMDEPRVN